MVVEVATPMYGGQCLGQYHMSVISLMVELYNRGHQVTFNYGYNESLIQRARNTMASNFLLKSQADVLLFIDADIEFDAKAMVDMLEMDMDVIGAVTPMKSINIQDIIGAVIAQQGMQNAMDYGAVYNFNAEITEEIEDAVLNDKPFEVPRVGTGVMAIKRSVLEKMAKKVKKYQDDQPYMEFRERFDFFAVDIQFDEDWGSNRMMSEDYNFCNLWRSMGGKVYALAGVVTGHGGYYNYRGDIKKTIELKRKTTNDGGQQS